MNISDDEFLALVSVSEFDSAARALFSHDAHDFVVEPQVHAASWERGVHGDACGFAGIKLCELARNRYPSLALQFPASSNVLSVTSLHEVTP